MKLPQEDAEAVLSEFVETAYDGASVGVVIHPADGIKVMFLLATSGASKESSREYAQSVGIYVKEVLERAAAEATLEIKAEKKVSDERSN